MVVVLCMCSCATRNHVEYVDREVIKYVTQTQHDTIVNNVHDSIYHTIYQVGDTVYSTKYVEKIVYRDKIVVRCDTIYRDSIQTKIKEIVVEKKKNTKFFYVSLFIWGILLIFATLKLRRWLQTR